MSDASARCQQSAGTSEWYLHLYKSELRQAARRTTAWGKWGGGEKTKIKYYAEHFVAMIKGYKTGFIKKEVRRCLVSSTL